MDETQKLKGYSAYYCSVGRKKKYFAAEADRDLFYEKQIALQQLGIGTVEGPSTRELMTLDEMRKLSANRQTTILDIFKAGLAHTPDRPIPLKDARDLFVAEKRRSMEAGEIKKVSFDQLRQNANIMVDGGVFSAFSDVTNPRFEKWLRGRGLSPKGLQSFSRGLGVFLNFCVRKRYLTHNPLKDVNIPDPTPKRHVFTVAETEALLRKAEAEFPELIPVLAVEWFAGVRPHTAVLLDYADFDRKEGVITIRVGKFTAGDTEFVERIPDALWKWLPKLKTGPIAPRRVRLRLRAFHVACGYSKKNPWPKDVARHTFASHFAAQSGSLDAVAFAMNHRGPSTTLRYYRKRVPQAQGNAYFALRPCKK
jgi:integrase